MGDLLLWYFAYGSNLDPGTFLGRRRMRPLATRTGRVDGYRVVFDLPVGPGERAVANLLRDPAACVWGVAYQLTRADAERLDRSEGVPRGYYRRLPLEVAVEGGPRVEAFSYDSPHRVAGRKPSPRYRSLLVAGARYHRLPDHYLRQLEAIELATDEREGGD